MEQRAIEMLKERTGLTFNRLVRFSDGCGAQFKSRFCVADLCSAGERLLGSAPAPVAFHYFESNEGKSESDAAGSALKLRAERMCLRDKELVLTCTAQLVEELTKISPPSTDKYEFCAIEEFPTFQRVGARDRQEVKLQGIRKLHQINHSGGGIKVSPLSCLDCAKLSGECEQCQAADFTVTPDRLAALLGGRGEEAREEPEQELGQAIVEGEGEQLEKSDGEGDGEEEEIEEGDIVWGIRYGKRAPAVVVSLAEVPQPRQRAIKTSKVRMCCVGGALVLVMTTTTFQEGVVYIKWVGLVDGAGGAMYAAAEQQRLVLLGDSPEDMAWGERVEDNYLVAKAMLVA